MAWPQIMTLSTSAALWLFLLVQLNYCVLQLPISSGHADSHNGTRIRRRQLPGTLEEEITEYAYWNWDGVYYIGITVGSPPQEQIVSLSTGSSNFWLNSATSYACEYSSKFCRGGTYNSSASETFTQIGEDLDFKIVYKNRGLILGPFANDTLGIGQLDVEGVQFGIAEAFNVGYEQEVGVMGLGYSTNEGWYVPSIYPNVPEMMVRAKVAASRLFSIALGRKSECPQPAPGSALDETERSTDSKFARYARLYHIWRHRFDAIHWRAYDD